MTPLQATRKHREDIIQEDHEDLMKQFATAIDRLDQPVVHTSILVEEDETEIGRSINDNLTFIGVVISKASDKAKVQSHTFAQVDQGAAPNIISAELANQLGCVMIPGGQQYRVKGISGEAQLTHGTCKLHVRVNGTRADSHNIEEGSFTLAI